MNTFQVVHRFRDLSNRGFVTPLACRTCSQSLTIRADESDEPTTVCYTCGAKATVSAYTLLMMEGAIALYERGRV